MPRAKPDRVVEHRLTLGNAERTMLVEAGKQARTYGYGRLGVQATTGTLSAIAGASAAGVIALGLIGLGLNGNLDREAIRNLTIGAPAVERTRQDGSAQVIENPLYGVPILGPLFGTGMRIGEKTAEAASSVVAAVQDGVSYQDAILREAAKNGSATATGATTIETQQKGGEGRGWSWASIYAGGFGGQVIF